METLRFSSVVDCSYSVQQSGGRRPAMSTMQFQVQLLELNSQGALPTTECSFHQHWTHSDLREM